MSASSTSRSRVVKRSRTNSPQFSAFTALLIVGAAVSVAATFLVLAGWLSGDHLDSVWALTGPALLSGAFVWFAYQDSTTARIGTAPEAVDSPVVLRVQHRLGWTFWLFTAAATTLAALPVTFVVRLLALSAHERNIRLASTGLAGTGVALTAIAGLLGMILLLAVVPRRIVQARKQTRLWLSTDGIGYAPVNGMEPGFIGWPSVRRVHHVSEDARGIVYLHRWTIYCDGGWRHPVIEYPAGATPRPRRIRRTIRELAPHVDV